MRRASHRMESVLRSRRAISPGPTGRGSGRRTSRIWPDAAAAVDAGAINWAPMWTPDGERLVFIVSGAKGDAVYWRRADGTGDAEHLIDTQSRRRVDAGG